MSKRTKIMIFSALGAVIMAICSWITIPGPVPFTMQTFAVFALLLIYDGGPALISISLYLLLGAVGVPVFAGFTGGVAHLLGPTGGYLLGFLILSAIYQVLSHISSKKWFKIVSLIIGLVCCYAFGTWWYVLMYCGGSVDELGTVLMTCVIPFVLPDAVKMTLAVLLSKRVRLQ